MDFVVSCSGDENNPLSAGVDFVRRMVQLGTCRRVECRGHQRAFFAAFPEMEFDSFLTIGADNGPYQKACTPSACGGPVDAGLEFDQDGPGTNVLVNDEVGGCGSNPAELTLDDSLDPPGVWRT